MHKEALKRARGPIPNEHGMENNAPVESSALLPCKAYCVAYELK